MEARQGLAAQAADGFATGSPRLDDACGSQATHVPGHERLAQIDVMHEVADGAVPLRQPTRVRLKLPQNQLPFFSSISISVPFMPALIAGGYIWSIIRRP